ncbi:MAG TPA: FmdB family zinc ribbon protein [Thermoanaerobaculia bacterium]|nr:FmdB family zinc ribbon protein [Thermoanaerobaculia bacterium]
MPIYEYRCDDCGRLTEALQRMADPPLTECEHCSGHLRKQVSAPAFQFKGSGWYVTDYANKSGSASGDSGDSGDSGGKSDAGDSSKGDGGGDAKKDAAKSPAAKTSSDD